MEALSAKPAFSGDPLGVEEPQRPFRVSGLLALLFGGISFSALFSTNLLFLPALAVLFAVIALRPERDPNVRPVGRSLAWIGATLALFFAGWSIAHHTIRTRFLATEGQHVARNWLGVLASGQPELAHELTLTAGARQFESMSLEEYYAGDTHLSDPYRQFLTQPPVVAILNTGDSLQWKFVGIVTEGRTYGADHVQLRFEELSGTIDRPLHISVERGPEEDGKVQWRVTNFAFVDEASRTRTP